jgi:hypothetical protein
MAGIMMPAMMPPQRVSGAAGANATRNDQTKGEPS